MSQEIDHLREEITKQKHQQRLIRKQNLKPLASFEKQKQVHPKCEDQTISPPLTVNNGIDQTECPEVKVEKDSDKIHINKVKVLDDTECDHLQNRITTKDESLIDIMSPSDAKEEIDSPLITAISTKTRKEGGTPCDDDEAPKGTKIDQKRQAKRKSISMTLPRRRDRRISNWNRIKQLESVQTQIKLFRRSSLSIVNFLKESMLKNSSITLNASSDDMDTLDNTVDDIRKSENTENMIKTAKKPFELGERLNEKKMESDSENFEDDFSSDGFSSRNSSYVPGEHSPNRTPPNEINFEVLNHSDSDSHSVLDLFSMNDEDIPWITTKEKHQK